MSKGILDAIVSIGRDVQAGKYERLDAINMDVIRKSPAYRDLVCNGAPICNARVDIGREVADWVVGATGYGEKGKYDIAEAGVDYVRLSTFDSTAMCTRHLLFQNSGDVTWELLHTRDNLPMIGYPGHESRRESKSPMAPVVVGVVNAGLAIYGYTGINIFKVM